MNESSSTDPPRLLAVMFTDLVGYTALTERDESAARVARARHRAVVEAAVESGGGELVQYYGDGSLSTFPTVSAAVHAALSIQDDPDVGLPLRIGIHQGEVDYDEQGIFGDSVNLAARVMSACPPAGVVLSAKAADEVKNRAGLALRSIGPMSFKNVREPIELLVVERGGGGDRLPDTTPEPRPHGIRHLLRELRRRKVYTTIAGYVVTMLSTWGGVELASGAFGWPSSVLRTTIQISLLGLPLVVLGAWLFEVRLEGRPTGGPRLGASAPLVGVSVAVLVFFALVLWTGFDQPERPVASPASPTEAGIAPGAAVPAGPASAGLSGEAARALSDSLFSLGEYEAAIGLLCEFVTSAGSSVRTEVPAEALVQLALLNEAVDAWSQARLAYDAFLSLTDGAETELVEHVRSRSVLVRRNEYRQRARSAPTSDEAERAICGDRLITGRLLPSAPTMPGLGLRPLVVAVPPVQIASGGSTTAVVGAALQELTMRFLNDRHVRPEGYDPGFALSGIQPVMRDDLWGFEAAWPSPEVDLALGDRAGAAAVIRLAIAAGPGDTWRIRWRVSRLWDDAPSEGRSEPVALANLPRELEPLAEELLRQLGEPAPEAPPLPRPLYLGSVQPQLMRERSAPRVTAGALVEYGRGLLAWDQDDFLTARDHFRSAVELNDGLWRFDMAEQRLEQADALLSSPTDRVREALDAPAMGPGERP